MIPDHDMHVIRMPHEGDTFAYFMTLDDEEGVVAVAKLAPWSDDNSARPFISGVHVDKRFRRQGVARGLMIYIERIARLQGMTSLAMYVHFENAAAKALYESLGYRPMLDDGDNVMYVKLIEPILEKPEVHDD